MSRPIAILRPEPGNRATVERLRAAGFTPIAMPLFQVRAIDWSVPAGERYDALLLTSANAVRFGGPALGALLSLPVLAVGAATAAAAKERGFAVPLTGDSGVAALLGHCQARDYPRLLHLGGRDRLVTAGGAVARAITVYAADAIAIGEERLRQIEHGVAMLHSARAASKLRALTETAAVDRSTIRIAAISATVAAAAGKGWAALDSAAIPSDDALIALAGRLAD